MTSVITVEKSHTKKISAALRLILHHLQGQNTQSLSPSLTQTFTTTAKHGASVFSQHASKLGKQKRCHFTTYQVMCTIYSVFTSACCGAETTTSNLLLVVMQTPDRAAPVHTEENRGCRTSPMFSAAQ